VNLPNWLTAARISTVPLLVWILETSRINSRHGEKELLASAVVAFAAITDRLDGYLARKRGQVTKTGMLLDPLADKLLIAAALVTLVEFNPHMVSAWVVIVVIARELLVTELRVVGAIEGFTIKARDLGKWKMAVQVVAVIASILDHRWPIAHFGVDRFSLSLNIELIARITIWAMVVLSVASALDYFVTFWRKIDQAAQKRKIPVAAMLPRDSVELTAMRSKQRLPLE
jgi:CDP-diacylglycerol---glycerol-3-phosphate 3-phosphatidyltransferase